MPRMHPIPIGNANRYATETVPGFQLEIIEIDLTELTIPLIHLFPVFCRQRTALVEIYSYVVSINFMLLAKLGEETRITTYNIILTFFIDILPSLGIIAFFETLKEIAGSGNGFFCTSLILNAAVLILSANARFPVLTFMVTGKTDPLQTQSDRTHSQKHIKLTHDFFS